ncbi:MAG: thermonuclease family protein [Gaiellaceae bacterium]|nr:thermonuclease family protein [Gaiellaceae bacterium]
MASAALVGVGALAGCAEVPVLVSQETRRVTGIVDGDTLVVSGGERVRLLQIDAPEEGGECYARAAARELARLAPPGAEVVLEVDPRLDRVDAYGRLLRYLRRDGANVNVALVRRGAAAPYFYRGERGRYAAQLIAALREARAAGRGMWRACWVSWSPTRQVETRPR